MPEPDLDDYLRCHDQVFLLTRLADGWPTGYPMVGNSRNGGIEFSTYRASAKVRHALRERRASCLVVPRDGTAGEPCLWVRGATSLGEDRAITAPDAPARATRLVVPDDVVTKVAHREADGKRCVLRVEVGETRWIPWEPVSL